MKSSCLLHRLWKKNKKTPVNVLVVDDELSSRTVLSNFLSGSDYHCQTAENGKQALELLQSNPKQFDVIILDRLMPYMSGLELLKEMHRVPALQRIPVIMLTGMGEKDDIIDAIEAGVFDYLTKPVEKELLLNLIDRALKTS
ncbi:MAG: response regulator [Pseudomonadota bacterium]|nr:response regulator [Gammaproteobacteria bacterium]MBU1558617.1 response regulator [Gammaproteobacteria bacterium]MBU1629349.1 response regulator [Gammaproteobacteria bacterium]MBU1926624.1 response regulator [Gammaproteobacteria bacterium]MBU2545809.1 response regulator [Gammaproteobacteria bacterium]